MFPFMVFALMASIITSQSPFELDNLGSTILNHKKYLKLFSSTGSLQARINFLHTCIIHEVIPKGFQISWKEQTGFKNEHFSSNISNIIFSTSKSLMREVVNISIKYFNENITTIESNKNKIPSEIWQKCIQNYNFCFNQSSQRLTKKLHMISNIEHI